MPLKVLVVDDATFVRDMVKRTVRQLIPDVEILEAMEGSRAATLIKSKKPDLILSDWEMPNMTGEQLLRWMRDQPDFITTPFIMVTSRGDRDHVMKAVEAGVNDYISKPFSPEELTRKVSKQLKRIGFDVKSAQSAANRGFAFASVDVLTGGKPAVTTSPAARPAAPAKTGKSGPRFKGKAYLRFANSAYDGEVMELSLQAICVSFERADKLPTVFDQATVDLIDPNDESLLSLNAYVHSVAATKPTPKANTIRVIARFVDQDPGKMEVLSSLIG